MYSRAGKDSTAEVVEFNALYADPDHVENIAFNEMYSIVESGEAITDATMAKEVED